jgi:hypothetical protein
MNYPFEKSENKINHADNGYNVECTHSGQKRRYGDTFREFTVKTDKPESEAKEYCKEYVYKCSLTTEEYLADERAGVKDFGDHFRPNYKFRKVKDGEYFYQVTQPSTH